MSTTGIPIYIKIVDGKFKGATGYIKRKNSGENNNYVCVLYVENIPYEKICSRDQFDIISKNKNI